MRAAARVRAFGGRPLALAAVAVLIAAVACLVPLASGGLDATTFLFAGDRFVAAGHTAAPLIIRHASDGYDGEFYYRMALRPWSLAPELGGVRFDNPAYRMQRLLYPLLAWAMSLGDARAVPWALFGLNLAGAGAVAALAALIGRAARLSPLAAVAIVAWPGIIVTLTHDTTEIVATAFALAALLGRLRERVAVYAAFAAAAILARETTALMVGGIVLHDAWAAWRGGRHWTWPLASLLAMLPFAMWRGVVHAAWRGAAPNASGLGNFGWPGVGVVQALWSAVSLERPLGPTPAKDAAMRLVAVALAAGAIGFGLLVALRLRPAIRAGATGTLLAAAWVPTAVAMALLRADGPWIEPTGILRAFTECYVLGCLVLGASGWRSGRPRLLAVFGAGLWVASWMIALAQLRAR